MASPRRCVSSRRQPGSAASSRSRKSAPRARASSSRARRSASLPDQRPPSAASRLVAMTGPGWLRKSRFRSGCVQKIQAQFGPQALAGGPEIFGPGAVGVGFHHRDADASVFGFRFSVFGGQAWCLDRSAGFSLLVLRARRLSSLLNELAPRNYLGERGSEARGVRICRTIQSLSSYNS